MLKGGCGVSSNESCIIIAGGGTDQHIMLVNLPIMLCSYS